MGTGDFYEDDESIEELVAAFDRGEKAVSRQPDVDIRGGLTVSPSQGSLVRADDAVLLTIDHVGLAGTIRV